MWNGRFQHLMLDVLIPRLMFRCIGEPFLSARENEAGKIEVSDSVLVPNYNDAVFYYKLDHPGIADNPVYKQAPAADKVKTAYTYLWNNFQSEVNEVESTPLIRELLDFFKSFNRDIERYQPIIKWIILEQEQAIKKPNSKHGREFIKSIDDMDHIITLRACLERVCKIVPQGLDLLASRLKMLSVDASKISSDIKLNDFSNYIDKQYRTKLMPYLVKHYTDQKPEQFGFMLYSLKELKMMTVDLNSNKTKLHQALESTFGPVGTRQALSAAIQRLSRPNNEDKRQITDHKEQLDKFLRSVSTS